LSLVDPDLLAALAALGERLPAEQIEQLWVFPRRETGQRASGLAVMIAYAAEGESGARRLLTLRYEVPLADGAPRKDTLKEEGSAPAARIPRIIEGVVRRTGEDAFPRRVRVAGRREVWRRVLDGGEAVDADCGE
jgi:hypothetical protein